jgi:type 2 lantibiotic biosynthesis protein LanM
VIAAGDHPVIIDAETLFHRPFRLERDESDDRCSTEHLLIDTGLIPPLLRRAVPYSDRSGFGEGGGCCPGHPSPRWWAVNSDAMKRTIVRKCDRRTQNAPRLGEDGSPVAVDVAAIVRGFVAMHDVLRSARTALLTENTPLRAFAGARVRVICAPTRAYGQVLRRSLEPQHLTSTIEREIELERLAGRLARTPAHAAYGRLWSAEAGALSRMDIPFFSAPLVDDEITAEGRSVATGCLGRREDVVTDGLRRMNDLDRRLQTGLIHAAYEGAAYDLVAPAAGQKTSATRAIAEVTGGIARRIIKSAFLDAHSAEWLALDRGSPRGVAPLPAHLYGGRCGVAFFLAAVHSTIGTDGARTTALAALGPTRRALRANGPLRDVAGLGVGCGIGSVIYALVRCSAFLNDDSLLGDARRAARRINLEMIAGDEDLDMMNGAAGAIAALLALHAADPSDEWLGKAVLCGEHLVARHIPNGGWRSRSGPQLAGLSHGAAGIAWMLLRLHAITGMDVFRNEALEAFAWENALPAEDDGNWPDLRSHRMASSARSMSSWCHGAPGIGLVRLSVMAAGSGDFRADVERAIAVTLNTGVTGPAQICCGAMGRLEFLRSAAEALCLAGLAAQCRIWSVSVAEAADVRNQRLRQSAELTPGLFRGVAGVGYQLLREVADLPSLLRFE